jgi:hypothetical protein
MDCKEEENKSENRPKKAENILLLWVARKITVSRYHRNKGAKLTSSRYDVRLIELFHFKG